MKSNINSLLQKILISAASILFCFVLLEILLRIKVIKTDMSVWVPLEYKVLKDQINFFNYEVAKYNKYGFTDIERNIEKKRGTYRIAVLGDSFVFGGGMPFTRTWSHRLEEKILQDYSNIEVLSWGRSGWSTKDELEFLKTEGHKFNPDLLLIGYTTNDPDLKDPKKNIRSFSWQNSLFYLPFKSIFPNSADFISTYINQFLENRIFTNYGYTYWENSIYSEENLKNYESVIEELASFTKEKKIKLLFVLTPNNYLSYFRSKFDKIINLLDKYQLEYLDLHPKVVEKLSIYKSKELCALPSDCHPGEKVVDLYVNEVLNYLKEKKILKNQ